MSPHLDRFAAWLRARSPHAATPKHYLSDLQLFFTWAGKEPAAITPQDVAGYLAHCERLGHARATLNRRIASLSVFYHFLALEADDAPANPVRPRLHFTRLGQRLPRDVSDANLARLFAVITDPRDRAIFRLMLDCGLRVGEVRRLTLDNLDLRPGSAGQLPRLRVNGKGGHQRVAYLGRTPLAALNRWLKARPAVTERTLFVNCYGRRLTVAGIQKRLAGYCRKAGVRVSCHQFRHAFGRRLAEARVPVTSIQRLMGHQRIRTTQGYIHLADPQARDDFDAASAKIAGWLNPAPRHKADLKRRLQAAQQHVSRPRPPAHRRKTGSTAGESAAGAGDIQMDPVPVINWDLYLGGLPAEWQEWVRAYHQHCQRAWRSGEAGRLTREWLSHLTGPLRRLVKQTGVRNFTEITPRIWWQYAQARLAEHRTASTLNAELHRLGGFLRFLRDNGRPICERFLAVKPLKIGARLPRDVKPDDLRKLLAAIEDESASPDEAVRRRGVLDRAWVWLMLYSGLRAGEVRRLKAADLDLKKRYVRIEQAKGLKDRRVRLTPATARALRAYLAGRPAGSDETRLFTYHGRPLNLSYCGARLGIYGKRCGVVVTPHQLRHSCATLLLNAGASVLTVQATLGHRHLDTTLGYARLYDEVAAREYRQAMATKSRRQFTRP